MYSITQNETAFVPMPNFGSAELKRGCGVSRKRLDEMVEVLAIAFRE